MARWGGGQACPQGERPVSSVREKQGVRAGSALPVICEQCVGLDASCTRVASCRLRGSVCVCVTLCVCVCVCDCVCV